jgi:hypothetical protein
MVNFAVFNEMSLPLRDIKEFEHFFEVLTRLKSLGLDKIRMDREFTQYPEILPDITFQQLVGQISSRDKKRRLLSFLKNGITVIESPLIMSDEDENEQLLENEYIYKGKPTIGALACCDIWNTITISFASNEQWNREKIVLQKQTILDEQERDIEIRHASKVIHLDTHQDFFEELEEDKKLGITQDNFWERREEFFPDKIIFCKEIEKQIKDLDKTIFQQAINILRDIETNKKFITDYNHSGESQSVKDNKELKKLRDFTIDDEKVYFDNHIKSLSHANRIYFLERDDKIYIGYIGKHLATKKFK